jgi:hypothetical protein
MTNKKVLYHQTLVIRNRTTNQVRLIETNSVTLAAEVKHPKTSNPFLVKKQKPIFKSARFRPPILNASTSIPMRIPYAV